MGQQVHPGAGDGGTKTQKWVVRPPNQLPKISSDVTLEWLQDVWSPDLLSVEVCPLIAETRPGVHKSDGGGASGPSICRLKLTWKASKNQEESPARRLTILQSQRPATAVLKLTDNLVEPAQPLKTRALLALSGIFMTELNANEVVWYTNNCRDAVANGYKMPICYVAACSNKMVRRPGVLATTLFDRRINYRTILILEDITEHKSFAQMSDLSKENLQAALRNQAILHASFWSRFDKSTNPSWLTMPGAKCTGQSRWLSDVIIGARVKGHIMNSKMLKFHKGSLRRTIDKLWLRPLADKLFEEYNHSPNPWRDPELILAVKNLEETLSDPKVQSKVYDNLEPQSLLHGDGHGWNHMFPRDDSKLPRAVLAPVYAVDFQMMGSGRVAWDLAYLTITSSACDINCYQDEFELLEVYYKQLLATGASNDKFDPGAFTFQDLKKEFCRAYVLGIVHLMLLMSDALSPKALDTQARGRKDDTEKKGETLTFASIRMFAKAFGKLLSYSKAGLFTVENLS